MPFKSKLRTEAAHDEKGRVRDKLTQPLVFKSESLHRVIVIPEGFVTDYASIPWWARWAFPKMGRHRIAAVLHDYLYCVSNPYTDINRERADELFLEAMLDENVTRWVANVMYKAVRAAGGSRYKKDKK